MASGRSGENSLAEFVTSVFQLVFHLLFPFTVVTLCGISYLLASVWNIRELGFWNAMAMMALDYAWSSRWAALALAAFVLASLPLAWVAFREQQTRPSGTILQWIYAVGVTFGISWLRTAWPFERGGVWQLVVYGIIMFAGWAAFVEAMLGSLAIFAHVRASRPVEIQPPRQAPHGAPREQGRAADEPETI